MRILLIEDNEDDACLIREILAEQEDGDDDLEHAIDLSHGLIRLAEGMIDVVLLDLSLPDSQGIGTFDKVHALAQYLPVVVLTGLDDKATAAQAIRRGAQDYLVKSGLDSDTLARALRYAIERKGAEEEIVRLNAHLEQRVALRTAELVALNKELESFSYSVSHDLRAPLRRIDGFSQALEEDYADKVDAVGKQHLERIRLASQRMGQLIDDLINLSRVTRAEMFRRPVDLTTMTQPIVTELLAMNPDHHVTWKIAKGLVAQGDPNLLRVVLENLLNNAWKYTRKRSDARIELGVTVHEGVQAFFVRDNGAGFDMAFAKNLFAPFQRFHDDSEFEGTGIGLATVQRIIHRHGGRVWAESEVNQGATFYFTVGAESALI